MDRHFGVLLYFPKGSLLLPERFYEGLTVPRETAERLNLLAADPMVPQLFDNRLFSFMKTPQYSPLYCDLEKNRYDKWEPAAKSGRGFLPSCSYDGTYFHKVVRFGYRRQVQCYHSSFWRTLDSLAEIYLHHAGAVLVLDCLSFTDREASFMKSGPYPDVCLGLDNDMTGALLYSYIEGSFRKAGYSVSRNSPYPETVQHDFAAKSLLFKGRVAMTRIALNRRLYQEADSYVKLRQTIYDLLVGLKKLEHWPTFNPFFYNTPYPDLAAADPRRVSPEDIAMIEKGTLPLEALRKRKKNQGLSSTWKDAKGSH